ncbi:MAG TPA: helix-turn-helix transcriptional regulator [Spirochaetota bacterium]|nr:helix-turn-helix transcriptional regulator [Spirochaetota bacterium]
MTDSEFIILSFVNDGLNYSYLIEKVIEKKKLRDYFDLSFSSIYFLINELENKKFVETYQSFGKKGVGKKGIKITETGKEALKKALEEKFSGNPILSHPIDYIFLVCHNSNENQIKNGLNKYLKESERIYKFYLQKKETLEENENSLFGEKMIVNHFISRLKNEIEWVKATKQILQSIPNFDKALLSQKEAIENLYRKMLFED